MNVEMLPVCGILLYFNYESKISFLTQHNSTILVNKINFLQKIAKCFCIYIKPLYKVVQI